VVGKLVAEVSKIRTAFNLRIISLSGIHNPKAEGSMIFLFVGKDYPSTRRKNPNNQLPQYKHTFSTNKNLLALSF
jgi:hypothetical protein